MFAKSVDRMDALLSQNPWNMFADPNAILARRICPWTCWRMVVELRTEPKYTQLATTARN
jgi:hypothetical protein